MRIGIAILSVLAVCQAGLLPNRFHGRVINGRDAVPGEIPFQVSLQYKVNDFHFCGGSVLNEKYVITAAHCVSSKTAAAIKVVAATTDLRDPKSTHFVAKITVHEEYNAMNSWVHDIALLKIVDKFVVTDYLSFVPLPSASFVIPENTLAHISGWGTLWEGGESPDVLQKADIMTAVHTYCKDTYEAVGMNIYTTHLCAYDPVDSTGSCHGDSGGPLMIGDKLVGLVSWAMSCASTKYPTVYTRVTDYIDWINANTV